MSEDRVSGPRRHLPPALLAATMLVTLAYFVHITTFYLHYEVGAEIIVDMGFAPSSAGVLSWLNVAARRAARSSVCSRCATASGAYDRGDLPVDSRHHAVRACPADLYEADDDLCGGRLFTNGSINGLYRSSPKRSPPTSGPSVPVSRSASPAAARCSRRSSPAFSSSRLRACPPWPVLMICLVSIVAAGALMKLRLDDKAA